MFISPRLYGSDLLDGHEFESGEGRNGYDVGNHNSFQLAGAGFHGRGQICRNSELVETFLHEFAFQDLDNRASGIIEQTNDFLDILGSIGFAIEGHCHVEGKFGAERNAGVGIIKEATRARPVPVLVVTGMPADLYRGVMRELDAWDYLQKPVGEHDFIQTLLHIHKLSSRQTKASSAGELHIDPLTQAKPTWKGERLNLSATQQRLLNAIYERRHADDPTVPYDELFEFVVSGKNNDNIKRQIRQIRVAFEEIEHTKFEGIVAEPMKGYRWVNR